MRVTTGLNQTEGKEQRDVQMRSNETKGYPNESERDVQIKA